MLSMQGRTQEFASARSSVNIGSNHNLQLLGSPYDSVRRFRLKQRLFLVVSRGQLRLLRDNYGIRCESPDIVKTEMQPYEHQYYATVYVLESSKHKYDPAVRFPAFRLPIRSCKLANQRIPCETGRPLARRANQNSQWRTFGTPPVSMACGLAWVYGHIIQ